MNAALTRPARKLAVLADDVQAGDAPGPVTPVKGSGHCRPPNQPNTPMISNTNPQQTIAPLSGHP